MAAIVTVGAQPLYAADVAAASCSRAAVQAAIDTAVDHDRVIVPAGLCTWTGGVFVSGKDITLQGAGSTATVITINGVIGAVHLSMTGSRVTGFGFVLTSGDWIVVAQGQNFHVDHNRFENRVGEFREAVVAAGDPVHPTGVVDSNEFLDCRVVVAGDLALMAHTLWSEPSTIGNPNQANVVYVEDNTFTFSGFGNAIDSNYGGRYVFRHNTLKDVYIEAHSVQGVHRGARSWEIYENSFTFTVGIYTSMFLRGGTGVVFNNTIVGPVTNLIVLDNVRSWVALDFPPGSCDGMSPWDGNTPGQEGWPCRDQIGRGADSPGVFPQPQASEPAYFWSNTLNGVPIDPMVDHCGTDVKSNGACADIVAGRDYFTSTARPGYNPFAYPHPARIADAAAPTLEDVIAAATAAVASGALIGTGPGESAKGRLEGWRQMLNAARVRSPSGGRGCSVLQNAYWRVDGQPQPPDFVSGRSAAALAEMIEGLLADLGCRARRPGR